MKEEFTFELTTPILYAKDGVADHKGKTLVITAPSRNSVLKKPLRQLKRLFVRVMLEKAASGNQDSEPLQNTEDGSTNIMAGMPPGTIIILLMGSKEVDIEDCLKCLRGILTTADCCKIDGKLPLIKDLYDKLSGDDDERLLGEYIKNFLPITL
jgi:hypothetical protein